jgi:anti-anti-sigma regulatory factor
LKEANRLLTETLFFKNEVEMNFSFDQIGNFGIFTFQGDLTAGQEDDLKIILMRAIHSIDRAVLNFKKVPRIDFDCLELLRRAYYTSVRLKNPLILINIPQNLLTDFSAGSSESNIQYSIETENSESVKNEIYVE